MDKILTILYSIATGALVLVFIVLVAMVWALIKMGIDNHFFF